MSAGNSYEWYDIDIITSTARLRIVEQYLEKNKHIDIKNHELTIMSDYILRGEGGVSPLTNHKRDISIMEENIQSVPKTPITRNTYTSPRVVVDYDYYEDMRSYKEAIEAAKNDKERNELKSLASMVYVMLEKWAKIPGAFPEHHYIEWREEKDTNTRTPFFDWRIYRHIQEFLCHYGKLRAQYETFLESDICHMIYDMEIFIDNLRRHGDKFLYSACILTIDGYSPKEICKLLRESFPQEKVLYSYVSDYNCYYTIMKMLVAKAEHYRLLQNIPSNVGEMADTVQCIMCGEIFPTNGIYFSMKGRKIGMCRICEQELSDMNRIREKLKKQK